MKTSGEIETDFFNAVQSTELAKEINGGVYRADFRPRDSKKEDIIVRFTAVTAGQEQEGVVTVLVFVPDIDLRGKGGKVRNSARLTKLEKYGVTAVGEIRRILKDYDRVSLESGVQSSPDNNEQHFVSIRIGFTYLNEDY